MGVYIYAVTPKVVKVTKPDGVVVEAQLVKYAYKPSFSYGCEKFNSRIEFKLGFSRKTAKAPYILVADDEEDNGRLLENPLGLVKFFDDSDLDKPSIADYVKEGNRFVIRENEPTLNEVVKTYTAFDDFNDLLNTSPRYRPTIRCTDRSNTPRTNRLLKRLADAYDAHQSARGDERRAYRG